MYDEKPASLKTFLEWLLQKLATTDMPYLNADLLDDEDEPPPHKTQLVDAVSEEKYH